MRFIIQFLPTLSILVAYTLYEISGGPFFKKLIFPTVLKGFVLLVIILNLPFFVNIWRRNWVYALREIPVSVVLGGESREDYLARKIYNFAGYQFISSNLSKDSQVLALNESYRFLTDCIMWNPDTSYQGGMLGEILFSAISYPDKIKYITMDVVGNKEATRCIRINQTESYPHWWSIYELKLFERVKASSGGNSYLAEVPATDWRLSTN